MTMSAFFPHAPTTRGSRTAHSAHRTAHALPEAREAADRIERGDGIATRVSLGLGLLNAVADVEQHLEQQLLALICGVEIGHAALVLRGLGELVGFAIHGLEIIEDLLPGTWTHRRQRYRFRA